MRTWLGSPGLLCALGSGVDAIAPRLLAGDTSGMQPQAGWIETGMLTVGAIAEALPALPAGTPDFFDTRNNRLLFAAALQIEDQIRAASERYGANRVAVVLGTSTSGVNDNAPAFGHLRRSHEWPAGFDYRRQAMYSPAAFLARWLGTHAPAYTLSTACTSSARALLTGRRLLKSGICDAVVCGGVDTLCRLTINGFASLSALSPSLCNPFSVKRDGINIGEAAALFVLARDAMDDCNVSLLGGGASSDGWHMSAPDPAGAGAASAMRRALADAALAPGAIGWLNLHGTATTHNDAMESLAVAACFPDGVACASTKPLTGHTLGAAGALEAALCWIALTQPQAAEGLPPHVWDGDADPDLPRLEFSSPSHRWLPGQPRIAMSNSFAFGGNNISLILGRHA